MAQSPSHRFGQIIGDTLEAAVRPILEVVATELGMYLDSKGERKARGKRRKVVWVDNKSNSHDLDYVLEAGGSPDTIGSPRAFIEIAWRRYTKHSRNKAQEIQGAILPLAERYAEFKPFLGVILAGVFTSGSLDQLRSHGFTVLYFPYDSIVSAFKSVGIDAEFDEDTTDAAMLKKVRQHERLSDRKKGQIAKSLRKHHKSDIEGFAVALRKALTRELASIYVLPLHGDSATLSTIAAAIDFIENFDESQPAPLFTRYEIGVRYSNGDEIRGQFEDKATAIEFLARMR